MLVSMLFVSASNKSSLADLILKTSESSSQRKLTSTSAGSTAFSAQILFSLAINCFAVIGFGFVVCCWFYSGVIARLPRSRRNAECLTTSKRGQTIRNDGTLACCVECCVFAHRSESIRRRSMSHQRGTKPSIFP